MPPVTRANRNEPLAFGPQQQPDEAPQGGPQPTPDGHVQTCEPSVGQPADPPNPNFILVPQPQQGVMVPGDLVQQIAHFMRRAEHQEQAKSFRFSQVEAQLASIRGRLIADQGSPEPDDQERRNPARQRIHRSSSRERPARHSPRRHSSWASSSPTRDRSRSHADSKGKGTLEEEGPYHRRRSPPRPSVGKRRNPFTRQINHYRVPRWLEKPPEKLPTYAGIGDPDQHIGKYEDVMDYRYVPDEMRCRIFPLSLDGVASEWFRSLKAESISSWDQLAKLFCDKFGHSRSKPKGKECLLSVRQRIDEPIRDYIERFNTEASTIRDLDDEFHLFFMIQGLLEGSDLKTHVRRWVPRTLQEFLQVSMNFINEEEGARTGKEVDRLGASKSRDDRDRRLDWKPEHRGHDHRGNRDPRPRNRHQNHTELNVSLAQLLGECCNTEFRDIKPPRPLPHRPGQRTNKYCRYHRSNGHDTNHCNALKDDIEDLIKRGKLTSYIKKPDVPKEGKVEEKIDDHRGREKKRRGEADEVKEESDEEVANNRSSKGYPVMNMIIGGLDNGESMNTMKRKWKELMSVSAPVSIGQPSERPPLSFSDEDYWDGKPNKHVPLVIRAVIANREVRRLLVDQGSSSDILFVDLLDRMGIGRNELTPYRSSALTGFDGSRTKPVGTIDLMVTYGSEPLTRSLNTNFLVVSCKSAYNGIIGRTTIGKLGAVCSTTHLKMKFHSRCNKVITLESDMASAARSFFLWSKAEMEARNQEGVPPWKSQGRKITKGSHPK